MKRIRNKGGIHGLKDTQKNRSQCLDNQTANYEVIIRFMGLGI